MSWNIDSGSPENFREQVDNAQKWGMGEGVNQMLEKIADTVDAVAKLCPAGKQLYLHTDGHVDPVNGYGTFNFKFVPK